MKIKVEKPLCAGHGNCNMIDDDLFPLDDDGYVDIDETQTVPDGKEDNAEQGVYNCPVSALSLENE